MWLVNLTKLMWQTSVYHSITSKATQGRCIGFYVNIESNRDKRGTWSVQDPISAPDCHSDKLNALCFGNPPQRFFLRKHRKSPAAVVSGAKSKFTHDKQANKKL